MNVLRRARESGRRGFAGRSTLSLPFGPGSGVTAPIIEEVTRSDPVLGILALAVAMDAAAIAEEKPAAARPARRPRDSWTLQVGLAHSAADDNHYAVSGFQARFPIYTLDRKGKSDRLGSIGLEVGG